MFGIITIALGERYVEMSKMLALSLLNTNPTIRRAVISDVEETEFKGFYDIYIPYNAGYGNGISQKLYLDKYSPFAHTLFIDADCLVFKSLDDTAKLCREHPFVVFGDQIASGEWYMDIAQMCRKFDLKSIPLFNGGTYYFSQENITTNIYNRARQMAKNYFDLGFKEFRGSLNEEPLIAIAMAIENVMAIDDKGIGMRTPIGLNGGLKIDVLNNVCSFIKEGVEVHPAIMHFAGAYSKAFHYKREIAKLRVYRKFSFLNKKFISFIINVSYNIPYGTLVFCKRVLKTILRREKFDFANKLPAFSNH